LKLGVGTNRWIETEIDQWLNERAKERGFHHSGTSDLNG
jgi:predicted DNA-binding transcriptional regulator AlpA